MKLTSELKGAVSIVSVEAERIDAAIAIQFKDQVREIAAEGAQRVVLDLQRVSFIDSSGLGAIVAAMKLMPPGCKLELAGLAPAVEKVFRMTRMDSIFTIHETADDAIDA